MINNIFRSILIFTGILFFYIGHTQTDIATVRLGNDNQRYTIEGVILNDNNERNIRFIQDNSAAIALYINDPVINQNLKVGDVFQFSGTLSKDDYLHLENIQNLRFIQSGGDLPEVIDISSLNESIEAQRVNLNCISYPTFVDGESWQVGFSDVLWSGNSLRAWVPQNASFIGEARTASYNAQGILLLENDNWVLYQESFESSNDVCLNWVQTPRLINAGNDFLQFELEVTSEADIEVIASGPSTRNITFENTTGGELLIPNLEDASLYQVEWSAKDENTNLQIAPEWYATQSLSSKTMEVYFNNPIRMTNSNYPIFLTGEMIEQSIIERIEAAQDQISIATYNFNNSNIRNALDEAYDRGVEVRAMVDADNSNVGYRNSPDFPVFYTASGGDLMHHKFIVIDPQSPNDAWIWMGATNLTRNQTFRDPNSAIWFQDQMLARVYLKEFNELWGGEGARFDRNNARSGANKRDDSPHQMFLGSLFLESYFSPSDRTTQAIVNAIESADESIYFSLLTFTQNDIRNAILDKYEEGVEVYGIIENINDLGGEYDRLRSEGIPVLADNKSWIHHHKYAVIDPERADARLIFGSHNWTQAAEDRNDENTLIIHDQDLAQVFLAEFLARYCDIDSNISVCREMENPDPEDTSSISAELEIFPNPVSGSSMNLEWKGENELSFELEIIDLAGQSYGSFMRILQAGQNQINVGNLRSGVYIIKYQSDLIHGQKKFVKF